MPEKKPVGSSDYVIGEESRHAPARPSHEEIALLAHALWKARGGGDGEAERDWLEAERQLGLPKEKAHAA